MILNSVTFVDFGTFAGQQRIDLRPKPGRPIILFGGKNGVGKTTLLEAVRLCLYGSQWNGEKLSREHYLHHLESRIHRNPTSLIQANSSSVSIEFDFSDSDGTHCYKILRGWERKPSGRIDEGFLVERNGAPLDETSTEYWHDFIRDLLPLGISQLFFFDGERIQQLAEDGTDQKTLSEAITLLLGVDLIERLNADLSLYVSRTAAEAKRDGHTQQGFEDAQERVEALTAELAQLTANATQYNMTLQDCARDVEILERQLSSLGAGFAQNRDALSADRQRIRAELSQNEQAVRELCSGLLPFSLLPSLCSELRTQLIRENDAEKAAAARQALANAQTRIIKRLNSFRLDGKALTIRIRAQLAEIVKDSVSKSQKTEQNVVPIHRLSEQETRRLTGWLEFGVRDVSQLVSRYSRSLEDLTRQSTSTETQLAKAPADEQIRPLMVELKEKYQRLAVAQQALATADQAAEQARNRLIESKRQLDKAADNLSKTAARESRLHVVPKVRSALEEFRSLLILRKVQELEGAVTTAFNVLCRKKDAMRKIVIDPSSFKVTVVDRDGHPIPKSQLSAGEKQVYAISMLWALGQISRRPLPIIIDTPLARLDGDHRRLLAENYFPRASHQIIMLSTDTEVDETYFELLSPSISHAYLLNFSPEERSTKATPGYFWRSAHEAH